MSPSKRLKPVQRLAHSREQKAAHHMGQSQRTLQQEETKLNQLKAYHQEYLQRFETAAKKGISASQLQEYRVFLHKLDQAIKQQEGVVSASQMDHSSKKSNWRESHTRTQVLNKIVQRYEAQEQKHAERMEQKETDDRSQQRSKS